jgi:hypothetical protein
VDWWELGWKELLDQIVDGLRMVGEFPVDAVGAGLVEGNTLSHQRGDVRNWGAVTRIGHGCLQRGNAFQLLEVLQEASRPLRLARCWRFNDRVRRDLGDQVIAGEQDPGLRFKEADQAARMTRRGKHPPLVAPERQLVIVTEQVVHGNRSCVSVVVLSIEPNLILHTGWNTALREPVPVKDGCMPAAADARLEGRLTIRMRTESGPGLGHQAGGEAIVVGMSMADQDLLQISNSIASSG